ncbi:MAG: hypothetical protein ACLURV_08780 [Gallintestinimicrobium sp.]
MDYAGHYRNHDRCGSIRELEKDIEYIQENGWKAFHSKNRQERANSPWAIYGHDSTGLETFRENDAYNPYEMLILAGSKSGKISFWNGRRTTAQAGKRIRQSGINGLMILAINSRTGMKAKLHRGSQKKSGQSFLQM